MNTVNKASATHVGNSGGYLDSIGLGVCKQVEGVLKELQTMRNYKNNHLIEENIIDSHETLNSARTINNNSNHNNYNLKHQ